MEALDIPPLPGTNPGSPGISGTPGQPPTVPPLPGHFAPDGGSAPDPAAAQKPKVILNAVAAGIMTVFAVWMTIADFSHSGDLLFQSSPGILLASLYASLIFLALIVIAAMPKGMIIGANLLLLFRCSMGFPLNLWIGNTPASRIATVALLILSLAWLITTLTRRAKNLSRPWIVGKHSAICGVAWLLVTLVTLPVFLVGYVSAAKNLLGNYLGISPSGIQLVERVFEKDGRKVHLVGMMHIGDPTYYTELKRRMHATPPAGTTRLVLTEGVSDRDHLLPPDFSNGKTYEKWAKLLGLETQKALGPSKPPRDTSQDLSPEPGEAADPNITWQNADGDIADMQPAHRKLLIEILKSMASADIAAILNSPAAHATGEQIEDLMKNGLIHSRNDVLMRHFNEQGPAFSEVWIPWGAAHLPDIEKRLLGMGYKETDEVSRPIVQFWK